MPTATGGSPHVVIIGAGVIGACAATYLQQQGARITLIDRQTPGDDGAASFGNAGSLSPSSWSRHRRGDAVEGPGLAVEGGRPAHHPLVLSAEAPALARRLHPGGRRSRASAPRRRRLAALHAPTFEFHSGLARDAGVPELVAPVEYLHIYGSEESYAGAERDWTMRREHGADFEVLDRGELREAEPDLAPHYVKGVRIKGQGRTLNPGRLIRSYVDRIVANGGALRRAEVTDIDVSGNRVSAVRTGDGAVAGDAFVLSAGAFSRKLTDRLGLGLPLDTERGYHVTCPDRASPSPIRSWRRTTSSSRTRWRWVCASRAWWRWRASTPPRTRAARKSSSGLQSECTRSSGSKGRRSGWADARACRTDSP